MHKQAMAVIRGNTELLNRLGKEMDITKESVYVAYIMLALEARSRLDVSEEYIQMLEIDAMEIIDSAIFRHDNK